MAAMRRTGLASTRLPTAVTAAVAGSISRAENPAGNSMRARSEGAGAPRRSVAGVRPIVACATSVPIAILTPSGRLYLLPPPVMVHAIYAAKP
ncbi:MAG TPA: hypothetical protein VN317_03355 [Candidatus Methanoperedens sp.]|nr:hypothetical protein [Candidatus Methanoperedens sp.]